MFGGEKGLANLFQGLPEAFELPLESIELCCRLTSFTSLCNTPSLKELPSKMDVYLGRNCYTMGIFSCHSDLNFETAPLSLKPAPTFWLY